MILDSDSDQELRALIEDAISYEGDESYGLHLASYVKAKYLEEDEDTDDLV